MVHRFPPQGLVGGGDLVGRAVLLERARDDLVLDVGDVRDVGDVESPEREPPSRDVPHEGETTVSEVGQVVDRRAAYVHRKSPRVAQVEVSDLRVNRIVEANHCSKLRQPWKTLSPRRTVECPKSPPSTGSKSTGSRVGTRNTSTASRPTRRARASSPSTRRHRRSRGPCTSVTSTATRIPTSWRAS